MSRSGLIVAALCAALAACSAPDAERTAALHLGDSPLAPTSPAPVKEQASAPPATAWPQACTPGASQLVEGETDLVGGDGEISVPARRYDAASRRVVVEVSPGFRRRLDRDGLDRLAWTHACGFADSGSVEMLEVRDSATGEVLAQYDAGELSRLTGAMPSR